MRLSITFFFEEGLAHLLRPSSRKSENRVQRHVTLCNRVSTSAWLDHATIIPGLEIGGGPRANDHLKLRRAP